MGPVNWTAVLAAAAVASLLGYIAYSSAATLARGMAKQAGSLIGSFVLFLLPAAMLGHMFARVENLAQKPWLYFMMSGGAALTLIAPLLYFTYMKRRFPGPKAVADGLFAIIAFLAMGTVFWVMS